MSLTATYDPVLSRVRVTTDGGAISSSGFEATLEGWGAQGGTLTRVNTQAHSGSWSALLTPDGVASIALGQMAAPIDFAGPIVAGQTYRASVWVRSAVALPQVSVVITWWTAADTPLTTGAGPTVALLANTWTRLTADLVAPATAAKAQLRARIHGTPPVGNTAFLDDVRVLETWADNVASVDVERSTNGVTWAPVRGGTGVALTTGTPITVDDYEFPVGAPVTYRATYRNGVGAVLAQRSQTITPVLDRVWLKFIARPFLNRAVTVVDFGDVSRPARGAAHEIIGRSFPVGTTMVRSSRRYELQVMTESLDEADAFDTILAAGEPVFVHVPAGSLMPRSMYAIIGDTTQSRPGRRSMRRVFSLPLTEVAPPAPEVVGSTITWQTIINTYATWADLIAAKPTWLDVLEGISPPDDVIVP